MRRNVGLIIGVLLIVIVGARSREFVAQVVVEPTTITSPTYVEVPAPQQEVITPAPSPGFVWVPGQWERTPVSWTWTAGQWVQPPFSNAYWVPGYWQNRGGQYLWETGHWAAADRGLVVAQPVALPPVYEEPQPAPVGAGLVWQPGYWDWRGTWVWVPGEYIQTKTPTAEWKQGEWEAGAGGNWRWNPAHWALKS
jgi:hypothetical protein